VEEVAMFMAYEVTRDLPVRQIQVQTPIGPAEACVIAGKKLAVVPILRAGLGMVEGILRLIPAAKVGHIGLYRDPKTLEPVEYFCKLPTDIGDRDVIVVDPMLATGGSAVAAVNFLKNRGAESIKLVCLISAPEGVHAFESAHPDVDIFTASLDKCLDERAYIIPGLGDAGDRLYGTR
ncbi:MAG: uracil phosphoribosyltransferase, partial [bacterium]|jgi:uracil phosphoribosyltransferase